ncbi:MAG: hypothetical protein WC304_00215 [Candidatus Gracilibacteria bacterium]
MTDTPTAAGANLAVIAEYGVESRMIRMETGRQPFTLTARLSSGF